MFSLRAKVGQPGQQIVFFGGKGGVGRGVPQHWAVLGI